jgi:hypothetical protein
VKLTRASLGSGEHVRLLAREPIDLSGYTVECRRPVVGEQALLEDGGPPDSWEFPADTPADEGWRAGDDRLRHRPTPGASGARLGITGDQEWTDYLVEATVRFQPQTSNRGKNAVGLLARTGDSRRGYAFTFGAKGAQFRRIEGATTRTLWQSNDPVSLGDDHRLAIAAVGSRLIGLIDGDPAFAVRDERFDSGGVGVQSRTGVDATVNGLTVRGVDRAWTDYHTVGDRERLPAGTEVELRRGVTASRAPGLRTWPLDAAGGTRLPPDRTHLRVLAPDGTVVHERAFRPDSAYTTVSTVDVLRSADGTGAIVTSGGSLPAGQYRLTFTYDRNGAGLIRGGQGGTERAILDVPWEPVDGS